ncbi:MAG TPA: M23 family metallopeptidase [Vicinamibacterales bacterium]|nr:M23 family metallopeptidase [Vicinamibacterales bacterium]
MPRAWRFLLAGSLLLASCVRFQEPERRRLAADVHPTAADVYLPRETETIESTVPRHATLDSLLRAHHLQEPLVAEAVAVARDVFDPRHLRADQPYRLVRSVDGLLREFEYEIDADRFLRIISRDRERPDALDAQVVAYDKQTEVAAIDARIDGDHTSLISSIDGAGEKIQLALELADIFSGQVDFHTELQPGDSFRVLFEKSSRDGEFSSYGAILGASIDVGGRRLQAIRWTDPSTGKAAYYDENGRSLKRFFLKSPLKFEPRVTSKFSTRRFHPIDHVYKAHLGVDYGAPTGSSVVAVAAGAVVAAGYSGAGGNTVHLKHPGGFETYYLHLSAFGPGIRAGARVGQGQLIGRVGMTGSATGPHLDYRLKKNGTFVNPVAVHSRQAPGEPIPVVQLAAFKSSCDAVLERLSTARLAEAPRQKPDAVSAVGK